MAKLKKDESEALVETILSKYGFKVEKIPESDSKTPDFLARDDQETYIIEVKTKFPNPTSTEEREACFKSGATYEETRHMSRQALLTAIVSKAKTQLAAHKASSSALQIIWFVAEGHNAAVVLEQLEHGLFGKTIIIDWGSDTPGRECYYFSESDFYRYRNQLDSVVLLNKTNGKAGLLINDHSERYDRMKASSLAELFRKNGALQDPVELDAQKKAYRVDDTVDRQEPEEVLKYVRKKYSLSERATVLTMKSFTVHTAIPSPTDQP